MPVSRREGTSLTPWGALLLVNLGRARDPAGRRESPRLGRDKHSHTGHKWSPEGRGRVLEDLGGQNFRAWLALLPG